MLSSSTRHRIFDLVVIEPKGSEKFKCPTEGSRPNEGSMIVGYCNVSESKKCESGTFLLQTNQK